MTVSCPACARIFRLAGDRLRPGVRLRCTRCGHLFAAGGVEEKPAAPPTAPREPARMEAASARDAPTRRGDRPLVLLADAGRPFRDLARPVLEDLGCRVETVEDGTEAFRTAVARRPALMLVSVHLGGLSGVAICEGVKGSPHLRGIAIALVGSDLSADLFNRDTALAYGADLFVEEGMDAASLRRALEPWLASAGAAAAGEETDDPLAALTAPPGADEEIRRLARIMLSDLRLYNPERYRDAVRENRVLETFRAELARGRDLVDRRFPRLAGRQDVLYRALREGLESEAGDGAGPDLAAAGRIP